MTGSGKDGVSGAILPNPMCIKLHVETQKFEAVKPPWTLDKTFYSFIFFKEKKDLKGSSKAGTIGVNGIVIEKRQEKENGIFLAGVMLRRGTKSRGKGRELKCRGYRCHYGRSVNQGCFSSSSAVGLFAASQSIILRSRFWKLFRSFSGTALMIVEYLISLTSISHDLLVFLTPWRISSESGVISSLWIPAVASLSLRRPIYYESIQ